MTDLARLTEERRRGHEQNLSRLRDLVRRLDDSASSTLSSPTTSESSSEVGSMNRSPTSSPMTPSPAMDDVQLPRRTTKGGDYGASIRESVIASYRIDRR